MQKYSYLTKSVSPSVCFKSVYTAQKGGYATLFFTFKGADLGNLHFS
jgi:hypothetical protein